MKSNLLTKRKIFYLNIVIGIVLILSILFLMRDMISNYFQKEKTLKKDIHVSKNVGAGRQKMQLAGYSSILKNNPFGFSGEEISQLTASMDDKAQNTDIKLIGTVVGSKKMSYGVFEDSSGMQDVFKVGDSVFGLGKLYSVKKDKALLRQREKTIEILLEDVKIKEVKKPVSGEPSSASKFAQRVGRGAYMLDQAKVQQAVSNPNQIMTDARFKPNVVNGRQEGFILSEVKTGGIYHSLGLQNGDVLLRINEYEISNTERALQAFTALKGMERVQIDLIRGGSKMTMTYQIK